MNFILMIFNPTEINMVDRICQELSLPLAVSMIGHGTAEKGILDFLGITSRERRVEICVATFDKTQKLIHALKRHLYIDIPGNGVVMSIPVRSIGGEKFVAYLSEEEKSTYVPMEQYPYELIVVLTNEGFTDMVMSAAREGGATGGTVLHGKGTGYGQVEKFFSVSLAKEKEVILIVTKAEQKAAVMRSVIRNAGPSSKAGALVFSLPVKDAVGFSMTEDE